MEKMKVTLGGSDYEFEPLTLGQMRAIGIGSAKMQRKTVDTVTEEANWYEGTFEIIAAATGKKLEEIVAIRGVRLGELIAANRLILDACGLIVAKADSSSAGEATGAAG